MPLPIMPIFIQLKQGQFLQRILNLIVINTILSVLLICGPYINKQAFQNQYQRYFVSMNKISDRSHNTVIVPVTPNLEQYKLHGKTKPKKKNLCPVIQPTLQPIHSNLIPQKYPTTPTTSKLTTCQNHPDRKAMYTTKDNNRKQFCGICAVTDGGGDAKFVDEQKYEKSKSIQIFKKRVNALKDSIANRQKEVQSAVLQQEDRYGEYFAYLSASFKNIIEDIEQKHRQLNNALIQSIHKRKQAVSETLQLMTEIKQSIDRYIYDINRNYEQILAELPLDNFRDIMKQYNAKVEYYTENVFKKICKDEYDNINVYLPIQEIRRVIDKANIQYFGFESDRMGSTRSLEKFMSCGSGKDQTMKFEREQREQRYEKPDRNDKHDRKSESKIQQRNKRNNTQNNMVHLIRGANKENNYLDSYYNYEISQQRSYNNE